MMALRPFALVLFLVATYFSSTEKHGWAAEADPQLAKIFDNYHEQYLILFPLEATMFGDSRYNDQLPIDIAPEFIAKEKRFYQTTLNQLDSVDLKLASDPNRIAAETLRYELQMRLEGLKFNFDRIPFNQFDGLHLLMGQLGSGSSSQPFKTVADYEAWLKRIEAFDLWSRVAIERFREGMRDQYVLPAILVRRTIDQLLDPSILAENPRDSLFYQPIKNFPDSFTEAQRNTLEAAYVDAIETHVMPAYRRMGEFLRDEYLLAARDSSGIGALNGGKDQYAYWVRRWTTTSLTPDEVFEMGKREVQRIRAEMEAVREEMGFQGSLDAFFEHLREDPQFKPFKSPEEILAFYNQLRGTVEPKLEQLFSRKPKTPFEVRRTESFREKTASAEYMPGSADGTRPGIFYVPIPDAKQYNITGGMESLFLHEALPGHHYQISLAQENESLPTFARFLWYGAYGEGWALYCESLGKELGLYTDPRQRMGALGDEMHRAIRLVVDVGMHAKGWTREEAIDYMMANEPIDREGAVAEIERYMAFTGQALSYKVGQLRIGQLREETTRRLGDQFSLSGFHDQVLRNGCLPLSLLEREIRRWEPAP